MKQALLILSVVGLIGCGGSGVPSAPSPTVTPTRIIALSGPVAFGDVQVGASRSVTLTVSNRGNSTLTWSGIGGGFADTSVTPPTSGTIAAGGSTILVFTFAPKAVGPRSAPVSITGDFTDGTNATTMSGNGIPVPPPPLLSAGGIWRGQAASTSCKDDGAAAAVHYCQNAPTHNGSVTLLLTQYAGGDVAGSVDIAGYPVSYASGSLVNDRLQISGSGSAGAFDYEYRNWNTFIAGNTMTGTFVWRLSLKSGGAVEYSMTLAGVTR